MFKVMRQGDLIQVIEKAGFVLIRNTSHKVYQRGSVTIMIPHSRTISSGIVHATHKLLKKVG